MKIDKDQACGKISYPTRALAKDALRAMDKFHGTKGMKPHRCPRCGQWHVGRGRKSKTWRRSKESGGTGGLNGPTS